MRIDILLTENRLAQELLDCFAARNLPEKFFYWFPLSVRAWLNLCQEGEYKNFTRSQSLILKYAPQIASMLPQGEIAVISLGSGQGVKDIILLQALRASRRKARYVPVDSSQALLEMACAAGLAADFPSHGLKADISDPQHIEALRARSDGTTRLFLLLGNTLGAFDPLLFCRQLRTLMRPEDRLLIDGEIFAGEETITGYDNPINRRFAFAPLRSVGITEDDGRLIFELRQDERMPGLYLLTKHFQALRDLKLMIAGELLQIGAGERIEMNFSSKYSRQAFQSLLHEIGGFKIAAEYLSQDGRFIMALVAPS